MQETTRRCAFIMESEVAIIGGGIAGISAAYFLSHSVSVIVLEREAYIGTQSTGRSAEQFTVGIAADTMRRLAQASRSFFENPPEAFAARGLVSPRGCLTVGRADQQRALETLLHRITSVGADARIIDRREALELFPMLRAEQASLGVYEPGAMDIDSSGLLQAYARGARARGTRILTGVTVVSIERKAGRWIIHTDRGAVTAARLINAAGAWVDKVTELAGLAPIGLTPFRRTAFTFATPPEVEATWPHVSTVDYEWYVQPSGPGVMVGSLAETVPTPPGDVVPDDVDVARAIDNIERDTHLRITRPLSKWAGLRSFVPDRNPVAGTRPETEGFFWLAGQGGCGILTSPALGQAITAVVLSEELPVGPRELGITFDDLAVDRARQ